MNFKWLIAVAAAGMLTACGGSSSGGGVSGGGTPVVGGALLTITADNAEETSADVVDAIEEAFDASGSALDFGGVIGARVEPSAAATALALDLSMQARDFAMSASDSVAVGVVITESEDCPGGGSITLTIDTNGRSQVEFTDALQNGEIPSGTSVSMRFNECMQPEQPTLSGAFTIVFEQFSIDGDIGLDEFTLAFSAIFDELATPEGMINGDMDFLLMSSAGVTSIEVGGDGLEFSAGADSLALLDYLASAVQDASALTQSLDFDLNISGIGRVSVTTLQPWTTSGLAAYPTSGALRVAGANSTSITVTALDEVSVQLEVDTDGDGLANVTIVTTWTELSEA